MDISPQYISHRKSDVLNHPTYIVMRPCVLPRPHAEAGYRIKGHDTEMDTDITDG